MQIFSSYKTKCGDFKRLFKELPESEQLIVGKSFPVKNVYIFIDFRHFLPVASCKH